MAERAAASRGGDVPAPSEETLVAIDLASSSGRVYLGGLAGDRLTSRQIHRAVEALEEVVGSPVRAIHVVGGGARAPALCQATANATGRPVLAGPAEAAVTGNMICQLIARGRLSGLEEGRALVRRSTHMESYVPAAAEAWDRAWRLLQQSSER